MAKVFAAVLVVTVVLIVVLQFVDPAVDSRTIEQVTTTALAEGSISVSIDGEVVRTGTYIMEANTTLASLIEVASGVTANADELAYDTSYVLADGLSFYIAPKYDNSDVCSLEPIKKVNINKDNAETLQTVSGIGSSVANKIVSHRSANGEFKRIEDIKDVSGVGNATFEKIKNYLVLRSA
ncbi:MAG: ComEA family DNA-binding protein [Bacilli bacterium]|nr:ComEA family DNA-binding protein [Bacilli bacterium]